MTTIKNSIAVVSPGDLIKPVDTSSIFQLCITSNSVKAPYWGLLLCIKSTTMDIVLQSGGTLTYAAEKVVDCDNTKSV
jgi:hypothetical protein